MGSKSIPSNADIVIIGGGQAAGFTALRLTIAKPDLNIVVLVEGKKLAENKTWYLHSTDLPEDSLLWIKPLITKSWEAYEVHFPHLVHKIEKGYHAIRSEDFDKVLRERLGKSLIFDVKVAEVAANRIVLENGKSIEARLVLDAREPLEMPPLTRNGFRKSISYELKLEAPHELLAPVTIDATGPQMDGYRFFRVLPWDEKTVVIEEVYHSDTPDLNTERLSRSVKSYAERKGWKVEATTRTESTVCPLPMTSDYLAPILPEGPIKIGRAGGYFHAALGVETAEAVRIAEILAGLPELTAPQAIELFVKQRRSWVSKQRFFRVVNRFVFFACEAPLRYQVYQRLEELPKDLIERFNAGRITWRDRLRMLRNRPEAVPLKRATRSFRERFVLDRLKTPEA